MFNRATNSLRGATSFANDLYQSWIEPIFPPERSVLPTMTSPIYYMAHVSRMAKQYILQVTFPLLSLFGVSHPHIKTIDKKLRRSNQRHLAWENRGRECAVPLAREERFQGCTEQPSLYDQNTAISPRAQAEVDRTMAFSFSSLSTSLRT